MREFLAKLLNFILRREVARSTGATASEANKTAAIEVLAEEVAKTDEKK